MVADIQKGGVFASIYGVYNLLPKDIQKNVIGVIVNKFQGDLRLFDEGVRIIEEEFGLKVFGVLPYREFNFGFEDSLSLQNYTQEKSLDMIKVGVINYPTMSNYNDFEPLLADSEIEVEFIKTDMDLSGYEMIILPGSKLTLEDLEWLKKSGLFGRIKKFDGVVFGICGGFEKMHKSLDGKEGLGFFDGRVEFGKKILNRGKYEIFGLEVEGFELHEGVSSTYPIWAKNGKYFGTFVHELFDSDKMREFLFRKINPNYKGYNFKEYKEKKIDEFVSFMGEHLDIEAIVSCISK